MISGRSSLPKGVGILDVAQSLQPGGDRFRVFLSKLDASLPYSDPQHIIYKILHGLESLALNHFLKGLVQILVQIYRVLFLR